MTAYSRYRNVAAILIAATFCASSTNLFAADLEERFRLAAEHFNASRWTQAATEFRKLIDDSSPDPTKKDAAAEEVEQPATLVTQARFYLGESLIRDGHSAEAIDALKPFVATSQDAALVSIARYRLGEACYLAGRNEEAREALQAIVREANANGVSTPTMPRVLFYLGDIALRSGDFIAAADWFGFVTAIYPDDELFEQAALHRIEAFLKCSDFSSAWAAARAFDGSTADGSSTVSFFAAQALDGLARHQEAAAAYDRYLKQAASDDEYRDIALYESAWNLKKLQRPAEAAARFEELVRTQPTSKFRPDAAYRAAEHHLGEGRLDVAASQLREARLSADDTLLPHVLTLQLQTALAANDRSGAEEAIAALAQKFPRNELACHAGYWQGEIAYRTEAWDDAVERFVAYITSGGDKQSPWFAAAVARRIEALAQGARWSETIAAVAESRTLLPPDAARFQLDYLAGRAHAAKAEFREAREAYDRVLAEPRAAGTETATLTRFMFAESHFHQRDYATALNEYAKVIAQADFPEWRAAALLQAGKCQEQLGRHADARSTYERLITEHATSLYAADAVRRRDVAVRQAEAPAGNFQRK
ncbi:MAG: tetratricopeptide repeat protein [Planctomycetia bacterium]|nr:tetratricopeptide repeat protein [Planctomycetia bacterium]